MLSPDRNWWRLGLLTDEMFQRLRNDFPNNPRALSTRWHGSRAGPRYRAGPARLESGQSSRRRVTESARSNAPRGGRHPKTADRRQDCKLCAAERGTRGPERRSLTGFAGTKVQSRMLGGAPVWGKFRMPTMDGQRGCEPGCARPRAHSERFMESSRLLFDLLPVHEPAIGRSADAHVRAPGRFRGSSIPSAWRRCCSPERATG